MAVSSAAQLWVPLVFTPDQLSPAARESRFLQVFARLKPGVTEANARAELVSIARLNSAANPGSEKPWSANVMTVQKYAVEEDNSETALLFLEGAVGFVLLIACANVVNLMLARNSARRREFEIRRVLGAGRLRLARQLLTECLALALFGGALGLLLAFWGLRLVRAGFNWNTSASLVAEQVSIDGTVLLFTVVVSFLSALIFGIAPALQVSRRSHNAGLKDSSRTTTAGREHRRLQNLLVVGELALSVILLAGAGLFVSYFIEEMLADPGLNPHNVLTASVKLSGPAYKTSAQQAAFFQNVLRRLASFPQVQSAAAISDLPFTFPSSVRIAIEGRPVPETEKHARAGYFAMSPGYFGAAQIPLCEGREFTMFDKADSPPVVIVNEAFVEKFFPHEEPLGRRVRFDREGSEDASNGPRWHQIVGVVGNVNEYVGQRSPRPHIFEPFLQQPQDTMSLFVRVRTEPGAFAASLRRVVWSVDKEQPMTDFKSMDRVMLDASQGDDLMAGLMGAFACIALLIAACGIYGLIAYIVSRRTQEIGVYMALGASRGDVLWRVMRNSLWLALAGVSSGFMISLALPRVVAATFIGFSVHSEWIIGGTPLIVIFVALASSYLPARRASKVDPMVALRNE